MFALSLLKVCPTFSSTFCLTPLLLQFCKSSIWELCPNYTPTHTSTPFSTISCFQPFLDICLLQLMTDEAKTTPKTNKSFGFLVPPAPFNNIFWCRLRFMGIYEASLVQPCKESSRKQVYTMAESCQGQGKNFPLSTTAHTAHPASHQGSVQLHKLLNHAADTPGHLPRDDSHLLSPLPTVLRV